MAASATCSGLWELTNQSRLFCFFFQEGRQTQSALKETGAKTVHSDKGLNKRKKGAAAMDNMENNTLFEQ